MRDLQEAIMDSQDPTEVAEGLVGLLDFYLQEGVVMSRDEATRVRQLCMRASELTHEMEE